MRILSWIASLLLAAIVITFALSNRQAVLIGLWPLTAGDDDKVALPVYLALMLPFIFGLLLGWLLAGLRFWRKRRAEKKETA